MYALFKKIITTPRSSLPPDSFDVASDIRIAEDLRKTVFSSLKGSLSIRAVDAGSSNAEELEFVALGNVFYDIERFGIRFVASPRHADALFVTGPVTRNMAQALRHTYEAMPGPKIVVAVGDGAIDGGIFKGSYATIGPVKNVIPVHVEIPGDPPSPAAIIGAMLEVAKRLSAAK